jgi:tRNA A-37 threonylcarbamoyl transferase component Bud32
MLQSNRLTSIPAGTFSQLTKLDMLLLSDNQITYIDPDMHGRWSSINVVLMTGNPSSCKFVLPLLNASVLGLQTAPSGPVAFMCSCSNSLVGSDFCVPANQTIYPLPPYVTAYSSVAAPASLVNVNGSATEITIVDGTTFYDVIVQSQSRSIGGIPASYALAYNLIFAMPVGVSSIPWVVSAFALDTTSSEYAARYTALATCSSDRLPRIPPAAISVPISVNTSFTAAFPITTNPIVPTENIFCFASASNAFTWAGTVQVACNNTNGLVQSGGVAQAGIYNISIVASIPVPSESLVVAVLELYVADCPVNATNANVCSYQGTCADVGNEFDGQFACTCNPGYTGSQCQATLSPSSGQISPSGVTAVIVVAVLVGAVATAVVIALVMRMRRKARKLLAERLLLQEQFLSEKEILLEEMSTLRSAWEIDPVELEMKECIGRGSFGTVHRARWRNMDVAVKNLHEAYVSLDEFRQELDKEATMLQAVRHAHIVQFHGFSSTASGCPFIVTELMEMGSLQDVLAKNVNLPWPRKYLFAYEIASGMALVHSLGRMHRDLKSANVLVSQRPDGVPHAKIADFGTATLLGAVRNKSELQRIRRITAETFTDALADSMVAETLTTGLGTTLWMAPEMLARQRYTKAIDVYSYGIVMWEIASQQLPWADLDRDKSYVDTNKLLQLLLDGIRPVLGADWPAPYVEMMTRCWTTDPASRPEFKAIASALQP